ncbi:hypothetical protein HRbin41_00052 [bacterium HR41]|nr:hypothetical protein HRbin41_00052 [bacterium HR41]
MEDDVGAVLEKNLAHPRGVTTVGEHGSETREVALLLELAPDLEERGLGVVDEHQHSRTDTGDLATQLRPDRATGSGDEHDTPAQVGADAVDLHPHRLAPEDILHPDLARLAHELDPSRQKLERRRQRTNRNLPLATGGHHLLAQQAGGGRNGDDHLVGLGVVEDPRQIVGAAEHFQPGDAHPALARVVVDEADRRTGELGVAAQLGSNLLPPVAGADDQHRARCPFEERASQRSLDHQRTHQEARPAEQREGEQQIERDHAARRIDAPRREHERRGDDRDRADHDRAHERVEVALVDVAPEFRVGAEQRQHHDLESHHQRQRGEQEVAVARGDAVVET